MPIRAPVTSREKQDGEIALAIWDLCRKRLPKALAANMKAHPRDPSIPEKKKDRLNIVQIRILPIHKTPKKFWSSEWCFYQIGIGMFEGSWSCLGGIQFLQFSNAKCCGNSQWLDPLMDILETLQKKKPSTFLLDFEADKEAPRPQIYTRYSAKRYKVFPIDQAAAELAWLINKSLPMFESLKFPNR